MSKIIIHNSSRQSDSVAAGCVHAVCAEGFVSGEKQYCWHVNFPALDVSVISTKTRGNTHTFKVVDEVMDDTP